MTVEQAFCDAIQFAIEYEKQSQCFYKDALLKVKNSFAQKALQFLINEEQTHIDKILAFNAHLLGEGGFDLEKECITGLPERTKQFLTNFTHKEEQISQAATDIDIYKVALETEKKGFELYESVFKSTNEERLKKFFAFLAEEEKLHYRLIDYTLKYLEDPSYYFEEAGGWIFG